MPINSDGVMTITPYDIKITRHLFDAFGEYNAEVSAQWLVEFAQVRGEGWKPFTYDQLESFYSKNGYRHFNFNNLVEHGFILADDKTQTYNYTEEFVARCYRSASRP
jgi:hypothetical protein